MGMGFTAKTKENNTDTNSNNTNNSSESWGMGFLFIFFPEEENNNNSNKILNKKSNNFSFSSSSSSSSSSPSFKSINAILKRSNSTQLLSKAQSTISICALLIFITLLLFTLSTFEPTSSHHFISRKQLTSSYSEKPRKLFFPHALQGMGSLYRRGTRAMNDLIIGHVVESVTVNELRAFLRLIHRSSVTSKSDILLIFPLKSSPFDNAIVEENNSFLKLIHGYSKEKDIYTPTTFDPTQFVISSKKVNSSGEPIWGRRIRSGNDEHGCNGTESTRLSYGSVVSFDVDELDPENSLSGFLENVSMNLRRWACYPMLLGRIRRNYKHIMLVDVKEYLVLGDSLSQLKNRSPETVMLPTIAHNKKKNSEKKLIDSGIVLGGARGIRRLGNAMVTEIARVAIQHKKKNSVSESGLFNQLVGNEFMLKNVNLINSGESIHELSSLTGSNSNSNSKSGFNSLSIVSKYPIVRRGNSNLEINSIFKKYLCSSPMDSIAYSDC